MLHLQFVHKMFRRFEYIGDSIPLIWIEDKMIKLLAYKVSFWGFNWVIKWCNLIIYKFRILSPDIQFFLCRSKLQECVNTISQINAKGKLYQDKYIHPSFLHKHGCKLQMYHKWTHDYYGGLGWSKRACKIALLFLCYIDCKLLIKYGNLLSKPIMYSGHAKKFLF